MSLGTVPWPGDCGDRPQATGVLEGIDIKLEIVCHELQSWQTPDYMLHCPRMYSEHGLLALMRPPVDRYANH